ncbi:hypothetical protein RIF29_41573 [Crotalaria pallida]|uniref:K Homology domain-containing protein n=1 Tax=Crotalaria pallida TaxID=3830 RepID=A0AAN9E5A9_CROPI
MGSTFLSPPAKRSDPNPFPPNGSSKRSRSRPPLTIPPGHVAFRLLCNSARIGGVIGRSGAVIQNLQNSTGAKIRIEDPAPDCPDRIIVVVAESAISGTVNTGGDGGGGGEELAVSKAQEALVRVFERIVDVVVEMEGIEVGQKVVSCRLVADAAQVGSVIGKGGKVVEKIRKESGCKIRAIKDNLPLCTSDTDEIIEIEGLVSSIKKALVAVSRRLQECPPADRTKAIGSKPYEAVEHETLVAVPHETFAAVRRETLTDLHVDCLLPRSSALSTTLPSSSKSYVTGVHSLPVEVNRVSSLDPKPLQQEVTFKILCSIDRVGGVIGKGGNIVKAIQNETGATISIGPAVAGCEDRLITITASENPESRYSPAQKAVVLAYSRAVEAGIEKGLDKGSSVVARLVVPSNQVGCLLGKGGVIVSEIRKATGASIRIIGSDQVPKCASDNDQVVQISGEFSNVQDALYNATGRLRDNLIVRTHNSVGTRSLSSVRADTNPYGRLRDAAPLGSQLDTRLRDADPLGSQLDTSPYGRPRDAVPLGSQLDTRLRDAVPLGSQLDTRLRDAVPLGSQLDYRQRDAAPLGSQLETRLRDAVPLGSQLDYRLRDAVPLGSQLDIGVSHSLNNHSFSQSTDYLGFSRSLDRPSSPGLWAPSSTVAGINSRGINDVSWGLPSRKGGLELVSGSKSAIVTNTTVEIVVPDDTIDCVYGENGSNLARLRQISGAKVVIHEPRPGTSDRTIVISGTPDETQAAQSLLQAFILSGS